MNDKRVLIGTGIALALILAGLGYVLTQKKTDNPTSNNPSTPSQETAPQPTPTGTGTEDAPAGTTIIFTDSGFSPQTYTTKKNSVVTVKNNSSMQLQFSSDDHPSHREETELNLNVIGPGETATFTPTQTGTWGFHDHIHDQFSGTLTVTD